MGALMKPAVVMAGGAAVGSVVMVWWWIGKKRKETRRGLEEARRKQEDEAAMEMRQEVMRVWEALQEDEGAYSGVVNDVLAHLTAEGSLQSTVSREDDGRVDYGAGRSADPELKVDGWYSTPTALLPAPVERRFYETSRRVSSALIRVIDRAATDHGWLSSTFRELAKTDEWTRRMLDLAKLDDGGRRIRCHVARADFMQDALTQRVVNIEVNTFAASLAGPAAAASKAHAFLLAKKGHITSMHHALPKNDAPQGIADAIARAVQLYTRRFRPSRQTAVLFVTVAEEDNELCHRHLERALFHTHGIVSLRYTIPELDTLRRARGGSLFPSAPDIQLDDDDDALRRRVGDQILAADNKNKSKSKSKSAPPLEPPTLTLDGYDIAVAYFRLCLWERYGLDGWDVRTELARATCVEIPSAAAHLAGLKRAQVDWSTKSGLERLGFASSDTDLQDVLAVSTAQWALDDPAAALRAASTVDIDARRDFVAKAARDGLMSHVFDRARVLDLCRRAARRDDDARAVIVQAIARPRPRPSLVLDPALYARAKLRNKPTTAAATSSTTTHLYDQHETHRLALLRPSVPELGIFVAAVAAVRDDNPLNRIPDPTAIDARALGHLVRSKHVQTADGGLCRGNAVVDSPLLYDDQ